MHSPAGAGLSLRAALPSEYVSKGQIQMQDGKSGMESLWVHSESITRAFPKEVSCCHRDQYLRVFFYLRLRSYRAVKSIKCPSDWEQCQRGEGSPFRAQHPCRPWAGSWGDGTGVSIAPPSPLGSAELGQHRGARQCGPCPGWDQLLLPRLEAAGRLLLQLIPRAAQGCAAARCFFKPATAPSAPNPWGSGEQRWRMLGGGCWGTARGSWGNVRGVLGGCQGMPGGAGEMLGPCQGMPG